MYSEWLTLEAQPLALLSADYSARLRNVDLDTPVITAILSHDMPLERRITGAFEGVFRKAA